VPTRSGFALQGWKAMNLVLSGSMQRPLRNSQSVTVKKPSVHFCITEWWFAPVATIAPSSTYVERDLNFHVSATRRRGRMYRVERMGDMGEPCGVPWFSTTSGRGSPLNNREMHWSVRKEHTQSHREGAKPRMWKMYTSRPTWRLSKKPWMSNSRSVAMQPLLMLVWMVWVMLRTASKAV